MPAAASHCEDARPAPAMYPGLMHLCAAAAAAVVQGAPSQAATPAAAVSWPEQQRGGQLRQQLPPARTGARPQLVPPCLPALCMFANALLTVPFSLHWACCCCGLQPVAASASPPSKPQSSLTHPTRGLASLDTLSLANRRVQAAVGSMVHPTHTIVRGNGALSA